MGKSLVNNTSAEVFESLDAPEASAQQESRADAASEKTASTLSSYHPTRWPIVNRALEITDQLSGGRAGWIQRAFSYLFFGGCAAVVNLIVFYIFLYRVGMPVSPKAHNIIAYIIAAEISILANFIPNDYFTFRFLPGHSRSWGARCLRFHITTIGGVIITFVIEYALTNLTPVPAIAAEAIGITIALIYNFTVHHLFTYGDVKRHA
jgi:putative flippase GtrA